MRACMCDYLLSFVSIIIMRMWPCYCYPMNVEPIIIVTTPYMYELEPDFNATEKLRAQTWLPMPNENYERLDNTLGVQFFSLIYHPMWRP